MKVTIDIPSWIDENEFEFVGYKLAEQGDYALNDSVDEEWCYAPWPNKSVTSNAYLCFRKKQKFVWPTWIKKDAKVKLVYYPTLQDWVIKGDYRDIDTLHLSMDMLSHFTNLEVPDTSKLDKDKVYIKGRD